MTRKVHISLDVELHARYTPAVVAGLLGEMIERLGGRINGGDVRADGASLLDLDAVVFVPPRDANGARLDGQPTGAADREARTVPDRKRRVLAALAQCEPGYGKNTTALRADAGSSYLSAALVELMNEGLIEHRHYRNGTVYRLTDAGREAAKFTAGGRRP